jgi:hypothetical protein
MDYYNKYFKYKNKYFNLKNQIGGYGDLIIDNDDKHYCQSNDRKIFTSNILLTDGSKYIIPPNITLRIFIFHKVLNESALGKFINSLIKFYSKPARKYDDEFEIDEDENITIETKKSGDEIPNYYLNINEQINCINTNTYTNHKKNIVYKKKFHQSYPNNENYIENISINYVNIETLFKLNGIGIYVLLINGNQEIEPGILTKPIKYCPNFPNSGNKIFLRGHGSSILNQFNIGLGTNVIKLTDVGVNLINNPLLENEIISFYNSGYSFFEDNDNSENFTYEGDILHNTLSSKYPDIKIHINIGENSRTGKPIKLINDIQLMFNPQDDDRLRSEESFSIDCMFSNMVANTPPKNVKKLAAAEEPVEPVKTIEHVNAAAAEAPVVKDPVETIDATAVKVPVEKVSKERILFNNNYVYNSFFNKIEKLTLEELIKINGPGTYIVFACRGSNSLSEKELKLLRQTSE